jgi:rod shape-determining protein MreC
LALTPRNAPTVVRLAAPIRAWAQRFSIFLFIITAVMLMVAGRLETPVVDTIRGRVIDAFAPILEAFAAPAATTARALDALIEARDLYGENQRLREQNAVLLQWQQAALRLEAENRSLRTLLNVRPDPSVTFVTARVVAEPGGAFVRTVLVMGGRRDGVKRGQAAMSGYGMVGRVVEVGEWSSRVLLVTDLNARIPVQLEEARVRAVLAGDNGDRPRLMHLPSDAHVAVGDRVVTSGVGGMFPAGLPIGVVASVTERTIRVQPLTDLRRLEHLKILDFGLPTNVLDPAP